MGKHLDDLNNIIYFLITKKITKIVVHGLYDSGHSHRYIHEAIYKTFEFIVSKCNNIELFWCNDNETCYSIYNEKDNENYLIFSSPHYDTDQYLPILDNAYYILHYRTHRYVRKSPIIKYNNLIKKRKVIKYIDFRGFPKNEKKENITFINDTFWYYHNLIDSNFPTNELHIPWATDLLPHEIDENIKKIKKDNTYNMRSYFCGTIWKTNKEEINEWKMLCIRNKMNCLFDREKDHLEHQQKIRESFIAPAIQGKTQCISENSFYVPCRIFKNISYGALPITNNIGVFNIFKDFLIIFDENLNDLFGKVMKIRIYEEENKLDYNNKMEKIMNHVKENHTFISRINMLISFGFM